MKISLFQKQCNFFCSIRKKENYYKLHLPEIAFLGKSNVGKSSLINALINNKKLVRSSNVPGSTLTINYFNLQEKLLFVDFPGYGYTKKSKCKVQNLSYLIECYLKSRKNLKMLILIVDSRRLIDKRDNLFFNFLKNININLFLILNKIDKLKQNELYNSFNVIKDVICNFNFTNDIFRISCTKKIGIKQLKEQIVSNLL